MAEHSVCAENRKEITVNGVTKVVGFDSESIVLDTVCGRLTVCGEGISIDDLSVSNGTVRAKGSFDSFVYSRSENGEKGFFAKLFK